MLPYLYDFEKGYEMLNYQESIIEVPGGKIWSELVYNEDTKNNPALICLHGGPGSTHNGIKFGLEHLAEFFPIIFYDQLGGGNSVLIDENYDQDNLWNTERFVTELATLIEFYKLEEFSLFGTSWGSSLALEYLFSEYLPKPQSLILGSPLVSTKMWLEDANILKQQMPADVYHCMLDCEYNDTTDSDEYQSAMEQFYNRHVLRKSELDEEQLSYLAENPSHFNMGAYRSMWGPSEFYVTGSLAELDRFHDLQNITLPTLFIGGEFDEARPETLELFQQQVSDSQLIIIPGASHCGYVEQPEAYSGAVRDFLLDD